MGGISQRNENTNIRRKMEDKTRPSGVDKNKKGKKLQRGYLSIFGSQSFECVSARKEESVRDFAPANSSTHACFGETR